MKYWNKPFVLEIYIRVTKKNCIYTIKIGYGLTLIQKSYVKSPLGFLSFQTSANDTDDGNAGVSIPFGVFTLPNHTVDRNTGNCNVSIPFGVFTLPNSISAIPAFMRAKLVVCGKESFFINFPTEISLKIPLSPVFMRCAVKFMFSFIVFVYYNRNSF